MRYGDGKAARGGIGFVIGATLLAALAAGAWAREAPRPRGEAVDPARLGIIVDLPELTRHHATAYVDRPRYSVANDLRYDDDELRLHVYVEVMRADIKIGFDPGRFGHPGFLSAYYAGGYGEDDVGLGEVGLAEAPYGIVQYQKFRLRGGGSCFNTAHFFGRLRSGYRNAISVVYCEWQRRNPLPDATVHRILAGITSKWFGRGI
jgi:hypothetical protein